MPQFDMILISAEDAADMERRGATILAHVAGSAVKEGGGDETYRCGGCRARLLSSVAHHDAHGAIIRCGKCGRVNIEPHHH